MSRPFRIYLRPKLEIKLLEYNVEYGSFNNYLCEKFMGTEFNIHKDIYPALVRKIRQAHDVHGISLKYSDGQTEILIIEPFSCLVLESFEQIE